MKRGYITPNAAAIEVLPLIEQIRSYGVGLEQIAINQTFDEFMLSLKPGDEVIIVGYTDVFGSLTELFAKTIELVERKIILHSINEPSLTFSNDQIDFVKTLHALGGQLRTIRTKRGLSKAKNEGKKLGRPVGTTKLNANVKTAIRLRSTSKITVAKACEIAGCQPGTYYRYLRKKNSGM